MEDLPDLGVCCCCGLSSKEGAHVRNILSLHKLAPVPGTGWGCFKCGIPSDGAQAVLCDNCIEGLGKDKPQPEHKFPCTVRWACKGYLATGERVKESELTGEFNHRMGFHQDELAPLN